MLSSIFKDRFKVRPLSWSQIASFEYSPEQWYKRYILNEKQSESPEMIFGKILAQSIEDGKPLAPVTIVGQAEYPFNIVFDDIPLTGFADNFCTETKKKLAEYKSGVKVWDQKRVDNHGQIDFYLLCNYVTHKIKPEEVECFLEWVPTKKIERENGDFSRSDYTIHFVEPLTVHQFKTKRTMSDILRFGQKIRETVINMENYLQNKKTYGKISAS